MSRIDPAKLIAYYESLGMDCHIPDEQRLAETLELKAVPRKASKGKAEKGSAEAKARMAKLRELKGTKEKASETEDAK